MQVVPSHLYHSTYHRINNLYSSRIWKQGWHITLDWENVFGPMCNLLYAPLSHVPPPACSLMFLSLCIALHHTSMTVSCVIMVTEGGENRFQHFMDCKWEMMFCECILSSRTQYIKMLGFHSRVAEDKGFLGYHAVSFWRHHDHWNVENLSPSDMVLHTRRLESSHIMWYLKFLICFHLVYLWHISDWHLVQIKWAE